MLVLYVPFGLKLLTPSCHHSLMIFFTLADPEKLFIVLVLPRLQLQVDL